MLPYTDMITVVYYSNRYTTRNTIVPLTRTEFTIPIFEIYPSTLLHHLIYMEAEILEDLAEFYHTLQYLLWAQDGRASTMAGQF